MNTDFWPEKVVIIDDLQQSIKHWGPEIKNLDWIKNFKSEYVSEPAEEVKKLAHENDRFFLQQDRCEVYEIESEEKFNKAKTFLNNTENAIVWLDLNLHQYPNGYNEPLHSYYINELCDYLENNDYKSVSMLDVVGGCILALEFKPIFEPPRMKLLVVVSSAFLPFQVKKKLGNEDAIVEGPYPIRGTKNDARNAIVAGLNRWVELRNRNLLDMFWTETNEWFSGKQGYPHNWNERNNPQHSSWPSIFKKTLERYLGALPADWFADKTGHYVHETVKTLCGNNSILGNGKGKPISIFAAYLIFLMGAHSELKAMHIEEASLNNAKNIQWNVFNKERRFIEVLNLFSTCPDPEEHKKAAKCLFRLGRLLAIHKSNNNVTLKTPFWIDETLTLSIPLSLGSNSKKFLDEAKKTLLSSPYNSHSSNNGLETSVKPNLIQLSRCKVWNGQSGKIILEHSIHNNNIVCIHLKPSSHQFVVIGDTRGESKDE